MTILHRPGLLPPAIIAGNRLLDLFKALPTHVTLMGIRNQHQPLLPWFASRPLPGLPLFIVQGVFSFSVGVGTAVNWTSSNPLHRPVGRTFPTCLPEFVARWHFQPLFQEPQQGLTNAPQLKELFEHQHNGLLYSTVRVFF